MGYRVGMVITAVTVFVLTLAPPSAREAALLADAKDGALDSVDFTEAALIASGVPDAELAAARDALVGLLEPARRSALMLPEPQTRAARLLEALHDGAFRQYRREATTLPELLALSKANPGTLNYGTAGSGTVPHLNMELLKGLTGLDATHVPYKAAAAVLTDVIGGRIQMAQESAGVVMPQIKAGKVRALAIVGSEPMPELPGVAPITATVPTYDAVRPWMGYMAPAGVPAARIAWLHAALQRVLEAPDIRQRIDALNLELLGAGPPEFAKMVRRDLDRFGPMVKTLNLKPD